jgi:hypothetical protein
MDPAVTYWGAFRMAQWVLDWKRWRISVSKIENIFLSNDSLELNRSFVYVLCLGSFWNQCTGLQVILTPTCRVSGYPRQVIKVATLLRQLRFIWTALPTVITLITLRAGISSYFLWWPLSAWVCFTGLLPFTTLDLSLTALLLLLWTHWTGDTTFDCSVAVSMG